MRTLVIAPNWIGDAVMSQPLLARLAAQDGARVDVLATPVVAPVCRAMAETGDVLEFANRHGGLDLRARLRMARELRRRAYARVVVLPNSLKSALLPFLARIPVRVGRVGEHRGWLLNRVHPSPPRDERPSMVEFYAELADAPGAALPAGLPDPVLRCDAAEARAVAGRYGLADAPVFVLAPGAEYGPAKRWPTRHFAALAHAISDEWPEAEIVLLGAAKERPLATEILALSGLPLRNLCGETTLPDALALVAGAAGVVSNDSGLMHVAAAYGRPQVALFGSSDPRHTPPRSSRAAVLWLALPCSPCFERECPLGHLDCLNGILPQTAFDRLRERVRLHSTA